MKVIWAWFYDWGVFYFLEIFFIFLGFFKYLLSTKLQKNLENYLKKKQFLVWFQKTCFICDDKKHVGRIKGKHK